MVSDSTVQKRLVVAGVCLGAAVVALRWLRRSRAAAAQPATIQVTQLWIHPVKSCSGTPVTTAKLDRHGFLYDREWCIVRVSDSAVLSQREFPKLKSLHVSIDETNRNLVISTESQPELRVPLDAPANGAEITVTLWKVKGVVRSVSAEAARWLSQFLGFEVVLARISTFREPHTSPNHYRICDPSTQIKMQDFSSVHIITEEGLEYVRHATNDATISATRFRPNIVLSGVPFPEEDSWSHFIVGGVPMHTAKHCGRCVMTTINDKGKLDSSGGPLAALRRERAAYYIHQIPMDLEGKKPWPMFGLNVFHDTDDSVSISVGDSVQVLSHLPEGLTFVKAQE